MCAEALDPADLVRLSGRTAIVTGGAMGIGFATARRLAAAGARVMLADRDAEAVQLAVKSLHDQDLEVHGLHADVSDEQDVDRMLAETLRTFAAVDVLVNNAGIFPQVPVLDMAPEDFGRVIDVNLRGLYLCSRAVARQLVDQGRGGTIVNVTSIDALHPSGVGLAHYDASKHGAWGFTKNLALELAPHRIRVNAVAPGGVATPGVQRAQEGVTGAAMRQMLEQFTARIPLGRMADPDEIAKVVLFLASDLASYMTGSQVVVDGGMLLT